MFSELSQALAECQLICWIPRLELNRPAKGSERRRPLAQQRQRYTEQAVAVRASGILGDVVPERISRGLRRSADDCLACLEERILSPHDTCVRQ